MFGTGRFQTAKLLLFLLFAASVCLAQFLPSDAANYAARAVTVTGQVSVLKDSQPVAISVGDLVQIQQMIVTGPNGHALFQIADGSTFEVYPNSNVVFRKNLFNWQDLIDVLVGRVRIHIEHLLGDKPNPNRVFTPTAVISVRGTTIDVSVDDNDESTVVEVEEGSVSVRHALLPSDHETIVTQDDPPLHVYRDQPLAQSNIDKGTIFRQIIRAMMDAAATMATRQAHVGIPGAPGGGGGGVGDTCKTGTAGCPATTGTGGAAGNTGSIPSNPGKLPPLPPAPPAVP